MHIAYLDSLRGIAICGVVMIHVRMHVPDLPEAVEAFAGFGLRGVQLFFIVSALTLSLVTRPETFHFGRFYMRRFFRIAPMFYLAAAFYLAARSFGLMDFAPHGLSTADVLSTLTFLHGFVPTAINSVVPGGWSIASEAIFYALFPLALFYVTDLRRAVWLFVASFCLSAVFLYWRRHFGPTDPVLRDFLNSSFIVSAPAFAAGLVLHQILRQRPTAPPRHGSGLALGLVVFAFGFAALSHRIPAPQQLFIPVLGLIVYTAARAPAWFLVNPLFGFLGTISFSIYVVHFAVLDLVARVYPFSGLPVLDLLGLYLTTVALAAAVAWAAYVLVESPMKAFGRRLSLRVGSRPVQAGG